MKILVTSGGTKVPIDRVRDITNMSKGTFGSRIATQALLMGQHVSYLVAQGGRSPFSVEFDYGKSRSLNAMYDNAAQLQRLHEFVAQYEDKYDEYRFRNFEDYSNHLQWISRHQKPDIIILAAAVSDYGVGNYTDGKIRSGSAKTIELVDYPKLIHQVKDWCPSTFLVGFKLMVGATQTELVDAAVRSIFDNRCDLVVANDYESLKAGAHELILVDKNGIIPSPAGTDTRQGHGAMLARELLETVFNRMKS